MILEYIVKIVGDDLEKEDQLNKMISDIKDLLLQDEREESIARANGVCNWAKMRIGEYWYSRMALLELINNRVQENEVQENITYNSPYCSSGLFTFKDLSIENNRNLRKIKNYLVSITHTKGVVASGIANSDDVGGIGLDMEAIDRRFSENTERMFKNSFDEEGIDLMKLWICKEAAYKALHPIIKLNLSSSFIDREIVDLEVMKSFDLKNIWIKQNQYCCYSFGICNNKSEITSKTKEVGIVEISLIKKRINNGEGNGEGVRYYLAKAIIPV